MASCTDSFIALNVAVLTVSDSRTRDTDTSGDYLAEALLSAGHQVGAHSLVKDDIYAIRAELSQWIYASDIDAVLITGGTGFSGRDSTPEAIVPLFDKVIDGFGELFRVLSYDDIGTSTIQSRAVAGFANETVIFALPGSTGACRLAWESILKEQLNSQHKPCNFVGVLNVRKRES